MNNRIVRRYRIGNVRLKVNAPEYADSAYLEVFKDDSEYADVEFDISFSHSISEPQLPLMHAGVNESWYSDGKNDVHIHRNGDGSILIKITGNSKRYKVLFNAANTDYFGSHAIMEIMNLPKLMLIFDAFFLHASFIICEGKAILFTADRQVGKSTQAALWEKHKKAEIANGDRALIRKQNGVWTAFGSPYSGTSGIIKNISAPISAIVILGQAAENAVHRADTRETLAALLSGASYNVWSRAETEKCFNCCATLATEVPFFKLDCLPDASAVDMLYNAMMET